MNRRADNEDLLSDVLSETTPADFRAAMLNETLRCVGKRRRVKQMRGAAALLAVLGLIGFFAWSHLRPATTVPLQVVAEKSYQLIQTQPLRTGMIITSRPMTSEQMAVSTRAANIIETRSVGNGFRVINDDELLALVAPRAVVLVRLGQNSEQLIFGNPEDAEGFPLN
jgi:hypothetical protein